MRPLFADYIWRGHALSQNNIPRSVDRVGVMYKLHSLFLHLCFPLFISHSNIGILWPGVGEILCNLVPCSAKHERNNLRLISVTAGLIYHFCGKNQS